MKVRVANQAYLHSRGNKQYRECDICYYTYNMADDPSKYYVNVNVVMRTNSETHSDFTATLALDKSFPKEESAIKFGIREGKNYIDNAYATGKLLE